MEQRIGSILIHEIRPAARDEHDANIGYDDALRLPKLKNMDGCNDDKNGALLENTAKASDKRPAA